VHHVRFGPQSDAPWEVVGSDDTTFTVETPAYGALVTSPVTVAGRITGVDENVRVAVRQLASEGRAIAGHPGWRGQLPVVDIGSFCRRI
jgi:hypothetical protein